MALGLTFKSLVHFKNLFTCYYFYFKLCGVFVAGHGLSLGAVSSPATVCCSVWASHCSDFFCCGAQPLAAQATVVAAAGSVVVECRLQCVGSIGVLPELSYSVACEVLLDQRSNLCPINWLTDSYPLCHQGSLLHVPLQFSQHHLLKRLSFSPLYILTFFAVVQ